MKQAVRLHVNGRDYDVYIEPWKLLSEVLRDELGFTGLKVGCQEGHCGTCTVLINGKAMRSCLILAMQVKGKEIVTIEGLADDKLHPLQQAFIDHFSVQCGFCTPGMIVSAKAFLDETPNPTEEDVRQAFAGNLCRCTGYLKIVEAILAASTLMASKNG